MYMSCISMYIHLYVSIYLIFTTMISLLSVYLSVIYCLYINQCLMNSGNTNTFNLYPFEGTITNNINIFLKMIISNTTTKVMFKLHTFPS